MVVASAARTSLLHRALLADAVATGLFGLMLAGAAGPLGELLSLPVPLLRWAGILLFPVTAFLAWLATRPVPPRAGVWSVITLNVVWTADSVGLLLTGWVAPNGLGVAFVIVQALAVAAFAELHYLGLRRG